MRKEIEAYKKGYRVTESGSVVGLNVDKLSLYLKKNGYYSFSYRNSNGDSTCVNVHRLQAFQKYGMLLFDDGIVTRHKNGINIDNSFDNILIGTSSENQMDIPEQIRKSRALHASSFIRKHNKIVVRKYHADNGRSYKKTMERFGISSKGTLNYILNK